MDILFGVITGSASSVLLSVIFRRVDGEPVKSVDVDVVIKAMIGPALNDLLKQVVTGADCNFSMYLSDNGLCRYTPTSEWLPATPWFGVARYESS